MSVKNVIDEAAKNTSSRKTKNNEMYYNLIVELCRDNSYVAQNVKEIKNGNIVTEDLRLAPAFREIIVSVLKKNTNLSEAEANAVAEGISLTSKQAKTLAAIVHEADYVAMKDCNKKVQLFKKPDLTCNMTIEDVAERVRSNPRDTSKNTKIKAHKRVKIQQTLYAFQKESISSK